MHQSRRAFLCTAAGSIAASVAARTSHAQAAEPPNYLIILTDDQGWGDVTSHGNDVIETPAIDSIGEQGARFDRFYVSPVCAPTRASVLTGRYHLRTGVDGVTHGREVMRAEETTIAELLRDAGYATGCFGKWHNGAHYPHHPLGQGFQEFYGFCAGHWNNYFDTTLEHNGKQVKTKGYINDVVTDSALNFIERKQDQPFFCYVPYNTPHTPFQVPDKYFEKYKAKGLDDALATTYGMCENLDDNIGRLLAHLDASGIANNTVVMFFGDNGPNFERYNGGMRGRKGSIHEGGVRNSCFMRWPNRIKPGTQVEQISAHIDLLPTFVEWSGVEAPSNVDGISLDPLLTGDAGDWPNRVLFSHWRGRGAVRTQQYRLTIERNNVMLFDMLKDPNQENDIAKDHPTRTSDMKSAWDSWYAEVTKNGLEPPPIPIGHAEAPVVELPAPEARLEGGIVFKGDKGWANDWITGWTSESAEASWDVNIVRGGEYDVSILYTCAKGDEGARVHVAIGEASARTTINKPYDPDPIHSPDRVERKEVYGKVWAELPVRRLKVPNGETRLRVTAPKIPGAMAMDLKAVRVVRVD